jgi:hypothetical protein
MAGNINPVPQVTTPEQLEAQKRSAQLKAGKIAPTPRVYPTRGKRIVNKNYGFSNMV